MSARLIRLPDEACVHVRLMQREKERETERESSCDASALSVLAMRFEL